MGDFTSAQLKKIKALIDESIKPLNETIDKLTPKIVELENETKELKQKQRV